MKASPVNRRQVSIGLLAGASSISGIALPACTNPSAKNTVPMNEAAAPFPHVAWSRQASMYEVNVRQFTPEGTLNAFAAHLPRLAQMGVGILWFMPIQPIGVLNRKGGLGSYYSIRDYTAVNPEFGSLADFKAIVTTAHQLGMKVILDWVANHTAWDHPWVTSNKTRYKLNDRGEVFSVTFGSGADVEYWTDVVGLNYDSAQARQDLWPAMTAAMSFWLREADIDGFRCDVASLVPTQFWEQARVQLERTKPVFMLAESDKADLHAKAFDMTYDWDLFDRLREIAKGKADASALPAWWQRRQQKYPADAYGMNFTANHDSNSWHGSCAEHYGSVACLKAMVMLTTLLPGMPLVYGGQEGFFDKRLQFFERDPIHWRDRPLLGFYEHMLGLKQTQPALANGAAGGGLEFLDAGNANVVSFTRERGGEPGGEPGGKRGGKRGAQTVRLLANLSAQPQVCRPPSGAPRTLAAWAYDISST
jgi:glycosidase